jgi:hypothetical protein
LENSPPPDGTLIVKRRILFQAGQRMAIDEMSSDGEVRAPIDFRIKRRDRAERAPTKVIRDPRRYLSGTVRPVG